jgi:hypothetical protein
MLPELSAEFLSRMAEEQTIARLHVSLGDDGSFRYEFT